MGDRVQIGEQYDIARRAPPSGFRRKTPEHYDSERLAERFAGMPKGVKHPLKLLAAFSRAAVFMGISAKLEKLVTFLFTMTFPQDWEADSRPIVWPSARTVEFHLQVCPSRAKDLTNALVALGLVAMKDSATGKRYGHRDREGKIIEAYGFDLSPLAVRYEEFVRIAEEGAAERRDIDALHRRKTIARKAIAQAIETAREQGLAGTGPEAGEGFDPGSTPGQSLDRLEGDTRNLVAALRREERMTVLALGVARLEREREAVDNWLRAALDRLRQAPESQTIPVNTGPSTPINRPHIIPTNPTHNPKEDTVNACQECKRDGDQSEVSQKPPENRTQTLPPVSTDHESREMGEGWRTIRFTISQLRDLFPRVDAWLAGQPNPNWADFVEAADKLRREMDISPTLWGDACITMGRETAAMAIGILSTKPPGSFQTSPGGYFFGMVAKAKKGELFLERSLFGLIKARERGHTPPPPEAYTTRPGGALGPAAANMLDPPVAGRMSKHAKALTERSVQQAAEARMPGRKQLPQPGSRPPISTKLVMGAAEDYERQTGEWPSWAPPKPEPLPKQREWQHRPSRGVSPRQNE